ncbi:hypothetical protein [Spirosoma pollinicola]|uniref:TonB C-terminal domain-containing protein n=1 Tax=Spirosoma pollinicola TaxID=2057025 RepID=A0A2K8Z337_9BACT|nr:hypothetical protein [Spirosoma pollinicola]AUD04288.1 hypothetical protein CWM47_22055 [Spirosoma pollinicola]
MKRLFLFQLGLAALLCYAAPLASQAQTKHESPVARDGFWVVETPPKGDSCVVRFYTNDKKLIYQETINRCLNIARRQTRRQLNTALDQAMFVWQATHQIPTDRQWVAVQFYTK